MRIRQPWRADMTENYDRVSERCGHGSFMPRSGAKQNFAASRNWPAACPIDVSAAGADGSLGRRTMQAAAVQPSISLGNRRGK